MFDVFLAVKSKKIFFVSSGKKLDKNREQEDKKIFSILKIFPPTFMIASITLP